MIMIFTRCVLFVFCLMVVSFDRGFSYGIGTQYNRHVPDANLREIRENLPSLHFLKQFIIGELNKKPNNYEYNDGFYSKNNVQPHEHAPSYAGNNIRPNSNENSYKFPPQHFGNFRGHPHHNHPDHGSFQNEKYDVLGPFPVDFGPGGFQHTEEYHRQIGDEKFTAKTEKPRAEYAVIEVYEEPDLPDPNVKYLVPSNRKPKLEKSTTQKSITVDSEPSDQQIPCLDTKNKQADNSRGFRSSSADCFGFPRRRPRPPPPPPRPSTTVAPVSVDPRGSPVSFISTSPSIDIRAKHGPDIGSPDRDSIVFPDD